MNTPEPDITTIAAAIAKALDCPVDTLSPESGLATHPEWDSLHHLTIIVELEETFRIRISDEEVASYSSVAAIQQGLSARLQQRRAE